MILLKISLIVLLIVPIQAANTDDEIVKDLDFFQNIEMFEDNNSFIIESAKLKEKKRNTKENIAPSKEINK